MVKTRLFAFIPATILAAACGGSSGPATSFSATLLGSNETGSAAPSSATGSATVSVNGATGTFRVTYRGMSAAPSASHIHVGAAGVAGAVVVLFCGGQGQACPTTTSGTFSGTFTQANIVAQTTPPVTTMDDLLAQLRAGNTYVNVHSPGTYAGGEIRGQLK
jgi:hypothetical protein